MAKGPAEPAVLADLLSQAVGELRAMGQRRADSVFNALGSAIVGNF